jgi:prepilin-type N-terminal cleavage/methylation domain-containing protein
MRVVRSAGFTLIELLVVVMLLGLVFLLLTSGLQFGTRVWNFGVERGFDSSEVVPVQNLLRKFFSEVRPVAAEETSPLKRPILFDGSARSVRFVTPISKSLGLNGFYEVTIYVSEGDESGNRVEISLRPFHRTAPESDNESDRKTTTLLRGVSQVQLAYFGHRRSADGSQWYDDWRNLQYAPELIRMRVTFRDHDRFWPDLIVAPMVRSVQLIVQDAETDGAIDHLPSAPAYNASATKIVPPAAQQLPHMSEFVPF